jgi:hypothetical protein
VANVKKHKKVHDMIMVMVPAFLGDISQGKIKAEIVENGYGLLIQWPSCPYPFLFEFKRILRNLNENRDINKLIGQEHNLHFEEILNEKCKSGRVELDCVLA